MLDINLNPFTPLSSERLTLRQITSDDENDIFILRSDQRIMRFIDRPLAESLKDATEWIQKINDALANNEGVTWGISLKDNSQLIGTIGLWRIIKEHHRAEIGYLLHTDFQGKGIMQEAIASILDYGFKTMKLHSVEAHVNPQNTASILLLERNKFVKEAHLKECYYFNGKFLDTIIYSLLTPDQ